MAEMIVQNPENRSAVRAAFGDHGVKLPLRLSDDDIGVVLDDDGVDVFTVDVNNERQDDHASAIALFVVTCVNTCGGFSAEVQNNG